MLKHRVWHLSPEDQNFNTLYKQIMRCLRYVCNSKPNICHNADVVTKLMQEPKLSHMQAIKWTVTYVKDITYHVILFSKLDGQRDKLFSFWPKLYGEKEKIRITMGYVFKLFNSSISRYCKKKTLGTPSSCEVKYILSCNVASQGIWL